jgi:hypothetical protein
MADVRKTSSMVQGVSTGVRYSKRDHLYLPTITHRYLGSDGRSRSITFDVAEVSTGYAYFIAEADGGRQDSPVARVRSIADDWYDRCKADGVLVTM